MTSGTGPSSDVDEARVAALIADLRDQVRTCSRGTSCSSPGVVCCAGAHLRPPALVATPTRYYATQSGKVVHTDPGCGAIRSQTSSLNLPWPRVAHQLCRTCGQPPEHVAVVAREARKVAKPLMTIAAAAESWPGRLRAEVVEAVGQAHGRLSRAQVTLLEAERQLGLEVAGALLASARGWTPPALPPGFLGAAAAMLVGVEDDPYFRSGCRPRTTADRAAAEALSEDVVGQLWATWVATASTDGLDGAVAAPGLRRPAERAAAAALLAAWTRRAKTLVAAGGNGLVVVAVPQESPRVRGRTLGGPAGALEELAGLAALYLPGQDIALVVVPALVARCLARQSVPNFELIGPWPGDDDGVEVLETLAKLAGGSIYRMPELLPVAVDLVRTGEHAAA